MVTITTCSNIVLLIRMCVCLWFLIYIKYALLFSFFVLRLLTYFSFICCKKLQLEVLIIKFNNYNVFLKMNKG